MPLTFSSSIRSIYILAITCCLSCADSSSILMKDGLRKLNEDEMVERARSGVFPDPSTTTYILESGDTISIDSLRSLDLQSPIALDDYVDKNDKVVLSIVRTSTEKDRPLKSKIYSAYNQYRLGDIDGSFINEIVYSHILKEERILNIYLPANSTEATPVIYLTDGGYYDAMITRIDKLISSNKIKPIIMVGVPSSDDHRFAEYVQQSKDLQRFENHMIFFKTDVINHVEKNILKRQINQENRYISGNSNGGDFSIVCALLNPSLFNTAISFSGVALGDKLESMDYNRAKNETAFYIGVGSEETSALITNKKSMEILKKRGFNVEFIEYNSGHDFEMWKVQFIEFVSREFGLWE